MDNNAPGGFDDEPPPEPRDGWLLVRIHVPELNVYKCLQFPSERLVWDVKQQVLASLPKELKESFNYGLFCPPSNGKAGKFLDEERRLGDYPFNGPVGYLELKYKRRVYKMLNLDERQLKALHTRANLRRFLECINGGHVEKIAKMCAKGLDPNFHCPESGETPLTVATGAKKPNKLLIALVNGGALLDYRTRDGATALHKAVEKDSLEAVTTLLELGASPNYKDGRGITPLYISITRKCDPKITESLLHDHAALGIQDNQGWQEVHQACRHGLVHHLEHLLFYGADMDGRNASGNTPLHVCAVNNQEACARMLLFRGAQRGALNYANQTPYQVAVIAGNLELAEMIQNYKSDEVVPFRGPPRYNPKRRSGIGWLNANGSCVNIGVGIGIGGGGVGGGGSGGGSLMGTLTRNNNTSCVHHGPPSPCPSEHQPYSSASSSLSEGSSGHRSHEDDISIVTDKSLGDTSDIISDSSGVGTNSDSAACSIGHPSTTVVCMEPYSGNAMGHIRLQPGDVIEVVGSTDCGLLEGYVRGSNQSGFFPVECVQEVNLRQKNITNVSTALSTQSSYQQQHSSVLSSVHQGSPQLSVGGSSGIGGGGTLPRQLMSQQHHHQQQSPSLSMHSNGSGQGLNGVVSAGAQLVMGGGSGQQYSSATAPRMKKTAFNEPRTVVLHRAKRGFGFILRGAKASSPLMQLKPSDRFPALQYLDDVDPGGVADMAGLRPGDFLLAISGEDVRAASHEKVVEMIRSAGALVSMTVISPQFPNQMQAAPQYLPSGGYHVSSGPSTPQTAHRQCATLPRKMSLGPVGGAGGGGGGGRLPAPMPPRRDPKTTLSVGRARAKSMVAGLENGGEKDDDDMPQAKSNSVESIVTPTPTHPGTPVQLRTASIKARPTSSRITAAELEELFQRQHGDATSGDGSNNRYSTMMTTSRFQSGTDSGAATPPASNGSPMKGPLVYSSVSEMKRKTKTKNGTLRGKPCAIPTVGDLKRFHSTPDLNTHQTHNGSASSIWNAVGKGHHSQDDVATLHASMQRLIFPPPSHPPPPPPTVGQVVKVETRHNAAEYESTLTLQHKLKKRAEAEGVSSATVDGVQSSFNPSANAKIYASPQELRNVMAWKLRQTQENRQNGSQQQKTQSISQPQQQQQQQQASFDTVVPPTAPPNQQQQQQPQQQHTQPNSQYAKPTATETTTATTIRSNLKQLQQNGSNNNQITINSGVPAGPAPPIPEPDYSLSESDGEDENSILVARNTKLNEKIALIDVPETSGNSQTSAASSASSGSASISHSLSVDEIQRIRSNLKTSTSYPNGLLKQSDKQSPTNGNASEVGSNAEASSDAHTSSSNDKTNNNNNNNGNSVCVTRSNNNAHNNGDHAADDNGSSGVSGDQEAASAAATMPTDTIKKKPSVTIVEEPKTIPDVSEVDTTDSGRTDSLPATSAAAAPTTAAASEKPVAEAAPAATTATTVATAATTTTTAAATKAAATAAATKATATAAVTAKPTPATSTVASTAAVFEAKATTVTVKQMVQQQHALVIQQQQQQLQQQPQIAHAAATKVKTLLAQSQHVGPKAQPNVATRIIQVHQHQQQQQPPPQQQHMHPNQKLIATQQHILMQQQQQQHQQHQQKHQQYQQQHQQHQQQHQQHQQQHQQHQLQQQHQQHLQQILKSKTPLGPSTTAAIVARQQQQQQLQLSNNEPTTESEHEQRSDDDGELSPSPPAKAFQRHNSLTRKQAAAIAMQRATRSAAVSLVQLPPPIEADSDNEMMSLTASSPAQTNASAENIVLAPPPQFCDCNDMKHALQQQQQQQQQHHHHHHQTQQQQQPAQPQHHHQQQHLHHHHHPHQQQQQQQHPPEQHHQQSLGMTLHSHLLQGSMSGGSSGGGSGSTVSSSRVRIVGAVPKTTHHRLH